MFACIRMSVLRHIKSKESKPLDVTSPDSTHNHTISQISGSVANVWGTLSTQFKKLHNFRHYMGHSCFFNILMWKCFTLWVKLRDSLHGTSSFASNKTLQLRCSLPFTLQRRAGAPETANIWNRAAHVIGVQVGQITAHSSWSCPSCAP